MRNRIIALAVTLAAIGAGFIPATTATAATPRLTVWGVTGYKTINPVSTVVWPRKTFATKAKADAYLVTVRALEAQVCPLAPVSCAKFVEAPVIVG